MSHLRHYTCKSLEITNALIAVHMSHLRHYISHWRSLMHLCHISFWLVVCMFCTLQPLTYPYWRINLMLVGYSTYYNSTQGMWSYRTLVLVYNSCNKNSNSITVTIRENEKKNANQLNFIHTPVHSRVCMLFSSSLSFERQMFAELPLQHLEWHQPNGGYRPTPCLVRGGESLLILTLSVLPLRLSKKIINACMLFMLCVKWSMEINYDVDYYCSLHV